MDDAVDLICDAVRRPAFETTEESRAKLMDLLLAARVKSVLVEPWPNVDVTADGGVVTVHTTAPLAGEARIADQVRDLVRQSGVEVGEVLVDVKPTVF